MRRGIAYVDSFPLRVQNALMGLRIRSKIGMRILGLLVLAGVLIAVGPRESFPDHHFQVPRLTDNFEADFATSEKLVPHLRPELAKRIEWFAPMHGKKTWASILYLHGYSASPKELSPVIENVGEKLGVHVFFQRLTGHGQDGAALGQATVDSWLKDTEEGLAVARRLGERVFVIGTSTGASLAIWLAEQPQSSVSALVLISPNFGPKDRRAAILTWPWGEQIANLISGGSRAWTPRSELHRQRWTTSYPTHALLPLMALVDRTRHTDLTKIEVPVLFVMTPNDDVLDTEPMRPAYNAWGTNQKEYVSLAEAKDHVLAGDAVSPETNAVAEATLTKFLIQFKNSL